MFSRNTWAAEANAASTLPTESGISAPKLPSAGLASRCEVGAPFCSAAAQSDTEFEHLEIDLDQACRVLGNIAIVGDDDGNRIADEADFVLGQAIRHVNLFDRRIRHQQRDPLIAHRFRQIAVRHDGVDARQRQRAGFVDAADSGMGMRAAQHHRVQHAGQLDVVDIAAVAGEQRRVLLAQDSRAEPLGPHVQALPSRNTRAACKVAATMDW